MVELYQHQSLWDCRQSPRVHQAFAELWGTEKLWVSLDRVNRKPPVRADDSDGTLKRGFGYCHWDFDTNDLAQTPPAIQGVLCLTDTPVGMGGFQCVPGFHKPGLLEDWIAAQSPGRNPQMPDLGRLPDGMEVTPVPARAGDLIVWSNRLAHGNGHNTSSTCRFAQYIALRPAPAGEDAEAVRADRIRQWRERTAPNEPWAPGDPTGWERAHQSRPAELSPLGRKLLGLDPW
jgi:ectoine hydroxylase-related dioxygenase (phytanoyl-CoA dioxygenase family)